MEMSATDFDLQKLVEGVVEFFGSPARDKGIDLVCDIDARVPSALRGDPVRLRQILINLIGNAVKFTEKGAVTVHVSTAEEDRRSVLLRFDVRDTGIGIPPESLPGLFQTVSPGDGSPTRGYGKPGLGLAIARQLVKIMGGRIGANSLLGTGSTFWFTARLERQVSLNSPTVLPSFSFRGLRVLVVAANTPGRTIILRQIEGWGIRYDSAADSSQAIEMLIQATESGKAYHAVILDEPVPETAEAASLVRAVRANALIAGTALIVLSVEPDSAQEGQTGVPVYLKKPVKQSELYDVLFSLWNQFTPAQTVREVPPEVSKARGTYSSCRVLLVDDNALNRAMSMAMLEYFGCRTDVAENGRQALEAFSRHRVRPHSDGLPDAGDGRVRGHAGNPPAGGRSRGNA